MVVVLFCLGSVINIISEQNNEILSLVGELVLISLVKVISFSKVDTILYLLINKELILRRKPREDDDIRTLF